MKYIINSKKINTPERDTSRIRIVKKINTPERDFSPIHNVEEISKKIKNNEVNSKMSIK